MDTPGHIGRYEIRSELGRGMMGVVYLAWDPELHREVALKTVKLAFQASPDEAEHFEQRFLAEARAAGRLAHPGIVIVYDVGRDAATGTLYMAQERLRGRTLQQCLAEGPLPWREVLRVAARVAQALHHAHREGVVHRDIKPANVMLLENGEPKVMDFGIAKHADEGKLTATGQFFGTPLYMAPEQALGNPVDARADLFSLGAVTYTLLTGRRPFEAESVPRILMRVAYDEAPPPSTLVAGLPPAVDRVLARAMAKSPEKRYPHGQALADDLEAAAAGEPLPHQGPPPGEATLAHCIEELPSVALDGAGSGATGSASMFVREGTAAPRPAPVPAHHARAWALTALLGFVVAAGLWWRQQGEPVPAPTPAAIAVAGLPAAQPVASPAPTPTTNGAPPPAGAAFAAMPPASASPAASSPATAERAKVIVDFEHGLESGLLRVEVDGTTILERPLAGEQSRKLLVFKGRKGFVHEVLDLAPGRHTFAVQVTWDDEKRGEAIEGSLEAGSTRALEVRFTRFKKDLSLSWK